MGSGKRFTAHSTSFIGLGFAIGRFPFALTINVHILLWCVSLGFGKGYDE